MQFLALGLFSDLFLSLKDRHHHFMPNRLQLISVALLQLNAVFL